MIKTILKKLYFSFIILAKDRLLYTTGQAAYEITFRAFIPSKSHLAILGFSPKKIML